MQDSVNDIMDEMDKTMKKKVDDVKKKLKKEEEEQKKKAINTVKEAKNNSK